MRTRYSAISTLATIGVLLVAGCRDEPTVTPTARPPTSEGSSPSNFAFIWALVVAPSGACIHGATITVVSGPSAGKTFLQDSECDAWSYSGGVLFRNLATGVSMTLRASASGYYSMEKTAVAAPSGQALEFDLIPIPQP